MFGKEPAVIFGGLGEVVRAIVPLLIIFGFIHWTPEQTAAAYLAVSVILGYIVTLLTRSNTTPTETVNELIKTAVKMPADSTVAEVKAVADVTAVQEK